MTRERFASQSSILRWARTDRIYRMLDTVYIVNKDGLFYYFSLDPENYYQLVMSSETNLSELAD